MKKKEFNPVKYLRQFVIILLISFLGEILHYLIPLPVPASIYGILLMLLCLHFRVFAAEEVRETGIFLIEIMPIMFIPAAVGLMESWSVIRSSLLPYIVVIIVSTIIVMAVSGLVTQKIINNSKKSIKKGASNS